MSAHPVKDGLSGDDSRYRCVGFHWNLKRDDKNNDLISKLKSYISLQVISSVRSWWPGGLTHLLFGAYSNDASYQQGRGLESHQ